MFSLWLKYCVFWISSFRIFDLRVVFSRVSFFWAEFSPRLACWALHSRCTRRSRSSESNCLWVVGEWLLILFRRLFIDINPAALITGPSLSSLSLCLATVSRLHAFFAFSLRNKITNEKRAKQRIQTLRKHRIVQCFSCDFRKVVDIVVWIVSERRVIVHRCDLVELLGLITSCWRRTWPDSQQLVLVRSTLDLRFQVGKILREVVDVKVSEVAVGSGLEVTVKEQQGRHKQRRVKHEKWEGESRETWHAHCRHPWAMHVCNTHKNVRSVRAVYVHQKMYVQQVSVCTLPVAHTVVATTWVRTTVGTTPAARKSKKTEKSSLHDHFERKPSDFLHVLFDLSHQDLVH